MAVFEFVKPLKKKSIKAGITTPDYTREIADLEFLGTDNKPFNKDTLGSVMDGYEVDVNEVLDEYDSQVLNGKLLSILKLADFSVRVKCVSEKLANRDRTPSGKELVDKYKFSVELFIEPEVIDFEQITENI